MEPRYVQQDIQSQKETLLQKPKRERVWGLVYRILGRIAKFFFRIKGTNKTLAVKTG